MHILSTISSRLDKNTPPCIVNVGARRILLADGMKHQGSAAMYVRCTSNYCQGCARVTFCRKKYSFPALNMFFLLVCVSQLEGIDNFGVRAGLFWRTEDMR